MVRHRHSRPHRRRLLRLHRPFATPQTLAVLTLAKPVVVLASPLVLARPKRPRGGPHGRAGCRDGARGQLQRRRTTRGRGCPPRRGLGPTRRRRRRQRDSIPRPLRILVDDDDFPPRRRPPPARARLDPVPRRLVPRRRRHRGFRRRQGALRVPRRRDRIARDPWAKALVHGELRFARQRRRGVLLPLAVLGELEADAEAPTSLSRPGLSRPMRVARGWGLRASNERRVVVEKAATRGRVLDRPRRGPGAIGGGFEDALGRGWLRRRRGAGAPRRQRPDRVRLGLHPLAERAHPSDVVVLAREGYAARRAPPRRRHGRRRRRRKLCRRRRRLLLRGRRRGARFDRRRLPRGRGGVEVRRFKRGLRLAPTRGSLRGGVPRDPRPRGGDAFIRAHLTDPLARGLGADGGLYARGGVVPHSRVVARSIGSFSIRSSLASHRLDSVARGPAALDALHPDRRGVFLVGSHECAVGGSAASVDPRGSSHLPPLALEEVPLGSHHVRLERRLGREVDPSLPLLLRPRARVPLLELDRVLIRGGDGGVVHRAVLAHEPLEERVLVDALDGRPQLPANIAAGTGRGGSGRPLRPAARGRSGNIAR